MKKRRWGGGQKKDQQEEGATEPGGENKVNLASLQILDDALHPACVIVVFFHHLLNEQKRMDIVRWCRQSQICGWSKAGHPGLIVAMGQRFHEVYDLVKKLRQLRWQTMEIRVELRGTPAWMEDLFEDGFAEVEMRRRLQEWSGSSCSSSSSSTPPTTAFSSGASSLSRRVGVGQELKTFRDYNIIDEDRGYEEYADVEQDDVDDDDADLAVDLASKMNLRNGRNANKASASVVGEDQDREELLAMQQAILMSSSRQQVHEKAQGSRPPTDPYEEYQAITTNQWPNVPLPETKSSRRSFFDIGRSNSVEPMRAVCPSKLWSLAMGVRRQNPEKYQTYPEKMDWKGGHTVFVGVSEELWRGNTPAEKRGCVAEYT
eukprot:g17328.t1